MDTDICIQELSEVSEMAVLSLNTLLPQLSSRAQPLNLLTLGAITADPDVELYVANHGDKIVGTLTLVVFSIPTGTRAIIEDVIVDRDYRGRSIGRRLLELAIHRARVRGAKTVDLTSRPDRSAANRLYLNFGFCLRETNVYRFDISG